MIREPSRLVQRRRDPWDAGRAAYLDGETWTRCPNYTDPFDRQRWQMGWDSARCERVAAAGGGR